MYLLTKSYLRLLLALCLGVASSSWALADTWTGTTSSNWNVATNWSSGIPTNTGTTAILFDASSRLSVSINTSGVTVGSLTFDSAAGAYTIGRTASNTLTLGNGGSVTNSSTNLEIFSVPIVLGGSSTWNADTGNLSVSGTISGASGSITKMGTATLMLSGANTYGGGTTISSGTLQVNTGGKLGTGGVVDNSTLIYNSANTISENNNIIGTGSITQAGSGLLSLTGTNTFQGGTTVSAGVLQFSSLNNFGSGAVALNGGTLRWATGNTIDVSGIISLGSNGGGLDTNGNNVTLGSAIAGSGPLIKSGTGTLTLSAASLGVTSVTVSGGTFCPGAANVLPSGIPLNLKATTASGSATFDLNGYDVTVGAVTFGGATSGANAVNTIATGTSKLILGGNVSYSSTNDPGTASVTGTLDLGGSTRTFNMADSANTATELNISANIVGTGGITVTGTGVLALSGSNTYTGATAISGATLQFTSSNNFGAGPVSLNGGYSTLRWAAGNTDGVAGGITLNGGFLDTNGNNVTLATPLGGTGWLYKTGSGTLTLSAPTVGNTLIWDGTLRLNGDNALPTNGSVTINAKVNNTGVATLDLDGHNLTINSLTLGGPDVGRLTSSNVSTGLGTLTLNGTVTYIPEGEPYSYYDPGTSVISGTLNLASGSHIFNVGDSLQTTLELNVTADVGGAGGINKTGLGLMALNGANTYSGDTIISNGTLRADVPTSGNLQMNGGVLELVSDRSFVYGTGAGQIQWTGGGGFSAYGGDRVIDIKDTGGTSLNLVWAGGNFATSGSTVTFSSLGSDSTVTLVNNIDLNGAVQSIFVNDGTAATNAVLSGIISNGGLNISGGGVIRLTGSNTYSGGTTISTYTDNEFIDHPTTVEFSSSGLGTGSVTISGSSTLRWASGNMDSLAARTLYIGTGGATLDTNGNNVALGAALYGSPTLTKTGSGTLILNGSGANFGSYVMVNGGTLQSGAVDALGTNTFGIATINANTPGGSAKLDLNGENFSVYVLTFGGATAQSNAINTVATGTGTLTFTGGNSINYTKATLDANDPGAAFLSGNLYLNQASPTFQIDDSTNTTAELTVSANISGAAGIGFTKSGLGTLVLSGTNTYTGNTSLTQGTLRVTSSGALSTKTLAITGGTLEVAGNNITLTNTITLGSSVRTISVVGDNVAINATLGGTISGTGGITKTGTGTLRLSGTNTYTGVTTISAGTAEFAIQKSLYNNTTSSWTATKLVVQSGATAAFNVGGTNEFTSANIDTLKGLGTSTGGFRNGSFIGLDTTDAGGSFLYASNIGNTNSGANSIGLTKLGTGSLILTGANTYTGGTVINQGTLQIGNGGTVGSISGNVTDNGVLTFDRSDDVTFTGNVSGNGSISQMANSTLTLSGTNTNMGGATVTHGNVIVTGSVSGSLSVSNGTFSVHQGGSLNGDASVGTGGTIGGKGVVNGNVTVQNGGTLWPGDPSVMTVNGNVTVNSGGTSAFSIANTATPDAPRKVTAGTDYDQVDLNAGNLTIQSGATLQINSIQSLQLNSVAYVSAGPNTNLDNYFVFALQGGTTIGQFDFLSDGTTTVAIDYANGIGTATLDDVSLNISFTGDYASNSTIGGHDVVITAYSSTVVPEPGTWVLLFAGLIFLIVLQRSRHLKN